MVLWNGIFTFFYQLISTSFSGLQEHYKRNLHTITKVCALRLLLCFKAVNRRGKCAAVQNKFLFTWFPQSSLHTWHLNINIGKSCGNNSYYIWSNEVHPFWPSGNPTIPLFRPSGCVWMGGNRGRGGWSRTSDNPQTHQRGVGSSPNWPANRFNAPCNSQPWQGPGLSHINSFQRPHGPVRMPPSRYHTPPPAFLSNVSKKKQRSWMWHEQERMKRIAEERRQEEIVRRKEREREEKRKKKEEERNRIAQQEKEQEEEEARRYILPFLLQIHWNLKAFLDESLLSPLQSKALSSCEIPFQACAIKGFNSGGQRRMKKSAQDCRRRLVSKPHHPSHPVTHQLTTVFK